jgi:single-stranded DNA-binding protein
MRKWQDQSGNDRYTTEVVLQRFVENCNCWTRPPRKAETGVAVARASPAVLTRSTTTSRFDAENGEQPGGRMSCKATRTESIRRSRRFRCNDID